METPQKGTQLRCPSIPQLPGPKWGPGVAGVVRENKYLEKRKQEELDLLDRRQKQFLRNSVFYILGFMKRFLNTILTVEHMTLLRQWRQLAAGSRSATASLFLG